MCFAYIALLLYWYFCSQAINDDQSTLDDFPSSDEGFREAKKQKQKKFYSEVMMQTIQYYILNNTM